MELTKEQREEFVRQYRELWGMAGYWHDGPIRNERIRESLHDVAVEIAEMLMNDKGEHNVGKAN